LHEYADVAGEGGAVGEDAVAGCGDVIAARGGQAALGDDDGELGVRAELAEELVDLVGGGDGAAGGVDVDQQGLGGGVFTDLSEEAGELEMGLVGDEAFDLEAVDLLAQVAGDQDV